MRVQRTQDSPGHPVQRGPMQADPAQRDPAGGDPDNRIAEAQIQDNRCGFFIYTDEDIHSRKGLPCSYEIYF